MKQKTSHKNQLVPMQTPECKRNMQSLNRVGISGLNGFKARFRTSKFAVTVLSLFVLFSATSCLEEYFVNGNHSPATEGRHARNFDAVSSSGEFIVNVVPGDEYSVHITAESNLLDYIETDVIDHTLKISTRNIYNIHNHEPMIVDVICPGLSSLKLSGSGAITADYFETGDFDVAVSGSGKINAALGADRINGTISGSGDIILTGFASEADFNISGSGKIDSYDLEQEYCSAKISGSGNMYVNVSEILDATISGSGKVFYINYPSVHTKISGSGEVVNRN